MGRYYYHKDRRLPSVTTIISDCTDKPALVQWAANCAAEHYYTHLLYDEARFAYKEISKQALRDGSIAHKLIENWLKYRKLPQRYPNNEIGNAFYAFISFLLNYDDELKTIATEHNVFGPNWAGTLDWLVELKGKLYVVDFKTSKSINPEMRYQTAAYRSLTNATGNAVLRLDKKTGEYEFKDFSKTYKKDLKVFNLMVDLFMERHPIIAKKAA